MHRRIALVGLALLAVLTASSVASAGSAGAGAEIPARALTQWCAGSADCTYAVADGALDVAQLESGAVEWLGVDEPLTAAQQRAAGGPVVHVPVMLGAVAVSVNIPGVRGHHVKLSGRTLGQIFSGTITNWADARVQRQNSNQPVGRGGPITLCVPAGASGTTWDMTAYLAKVSPEFRARVGGASTRPASWRAPRVVRVADVAALGRCVAARNGAIAFWNYADALRAGDVEDIVAVGGTQTVRYPRTGLPTVERDELVYRHPGQQTMLAAGRQAERSLGGRLVFDVSAAGAQDAYPIAELSWVAYRADRGLSTGARKSLAFMLSRAGQAQLQGLGYARLSPKTLASARRTVATAPRARGGGERASGAPSARASVTPTAVAQAIANTGLLTLSGVTITSTSSPVAATATLTTVNNPTPMQVSVSYTDAKDWSITIEENSAGAAYTSPAGTALDVNDISGTITSTAGVLAFNLTLSGQTLGDATFDMAASVSAANGLQATANLSSLVIGGMVLQSATATVSTATATASIAGTLETDGGTFDASLAVIGPGPAAGSMDPSCDFSFMQSSSLCTASPTYTITLSVSGADLAGSNPEFDVQSFGFTTTISTLSYGCTDVTVSFSGSIAMGNNTFTMNDGTIEFCGQALEKFVFDVSFSHFQEWDGVTKTATLDVAWASRPGTYTAPTGTAVNYESGFFGSVDLSASRSFSKKYRDRHFDRTITIGLGFGVAVYTPSAGGPENDLIGGGGYVTADRVSGAIGCVLQVAPGTDMNCGVDMRINPSWAGIYHYTWDDL